MFTRLRLLALLFSGCATFAAAALDATSSRGADLSGSWQLNAALSDDAERMLEERQREEWERYLTWRRRQEKSYPPGAPPIDIDGPGPATQREPSSARRASMKRREENLHKMLAISDTLAIKQEGSTFDLASKVESRRVVAGSRTQVSMPEGQLADSRVGWDGPWFVIDRRVRGGPRVLERFRLMPKTGQLEYEMKWSGDGELDGMKIRRVFDRVTVTPPPADPAAGPVR
ncbi:MAG TPA: hypothetical protein VFO35_15420 [Steroidobacteraceae bacterium]|nr:hypothetical protein [Steroidobacteraceae bacterium]